MLISPNALLCVALQCCTDPLWTNLTTVYIGVFEMMWFGVFWLFVELRSCRLCNDSAMLIILNFARLLYGEPYLWYVMASDIWGFSAFLVSACFLVVCSLTTETEEDTDNGTIVSVVIRILVESVRWKIFCERWLCCFGVCVWHMFWLECCMMSRAESHHIFDNYLQDRFLNLMGVFCSWLTSGW